MKPFEEFMEPLFPRQMDSRWNQLGGREPNLDLQDRGTHFVITAELPGFEKKEVEVRVSSNVLELKAERKSQKEYESDGSTSRESSHAVFHRYLTLPAEVRSEEVNGTMKNGVLELKLPKAEHEARDNSRRIDLK